jgi:hypothetical protein
MRTINRKQYKKLHEVACVEWRTKLEERFAHSLVLHEEAKVLEAEYNKMRSAATASQNELLDSIFGKDEPEFKKDEYAIAITSSAKWSKGDIFKVLDTTPCKCGEKRISIGLDYDPMCSKCERKINDTWNPKCFRHATLSEIEAYKKENEVVRVYINIDGNGYIFPANYRAIDNKGYYDIPIKDLKK